MDLRKLWILPAAAIVLSGCAETEGPLDPGLRSGLADEVQTSLSCVADLRGGTVSCSQPEGSAGAAAGAILGGQNELLLLESFNVAYDDTEAEFSADVALRNYLNQPLGTADGTTADADGIRVFFLSAPQVTAGSGAVSVKNADGSAHFTTDGQPYFQYDELLESGQSTKTKSWVWDVPASVDAFTFMVGVSASVPDENNLEGDVKLVASSISVGADHACALDADGRAYCWGSNATGQLGIGTFGNRTQPTPVNTTETFVQISAGQTHTCAVDPNGDAYCWGNGASNRLASGSTDAQYSPIKILGGQTFLSVTAGGALTCGVSINNDALCWGGNGNAKTGQGTTSGSIGTPTVVQGGLKYKSVSAGYYNACGITTDDVAVCWGNGNSGRSGDGDPISTHNVLEPTPIQSEHKFSVINAGSAYTCALTVDGQAFCFGSNGSGQHGNGRQGDGTATGVPQAVLGNHTFDVISNRFAHTCGIKINEGELWCWGNYGNGRLGAEFEEHQDEPVLIDSTHGFVSVGVGTQNTCAMTADGEVYCWGQGEFGMIGNGGDENRSTPVPVSTIGPAGLPL